MKKLIFITCAISILFFSVACKRNIVCPEFTNHQIIPAAYYEGMIIEFRDNQNNERKLEIVEVKKSEAYEYNCKDLHNICHCETSAEIWVKNSGQENPFLFLQIVLNVNNNQEVFRFNFSQFSFEFDFFNDFQYIELMPQLTYIGELQIGALEYNEVLMIVNDENAQSNIDKVYFNKENGIIRFIEKTAAKVWTIN